MLQIIHHLSWTPSFTDWREDQNQYVQSCC